MTTPNAGEEPETDHSHAAGGNVKNGGAALEKRGNSSEGKA